MSRKQWTVMVWMAGDNDLESFALGDIAELKKIGSTDDVDVVAQVDTMRDDKTHRYHLHHGTGLDADVVANLGETNTGDPRVAIDFFTWGITKHPAERYLAVIWNHGSGIDETDVYRHAARRGLRIERHGVEAGVLPRRLARVVASRRFRRSLFDSTVHAALESRAIAYDDTSRDFLDNAELKRVLVEVTRATHRTIDILGFDACLMNMIEVACQLRGTADHIVGSEEVEPGDGWPYDQVLATLAKTPRTTPADLAKRIVDLYVKSYPRDSVTLSALDLRHVDAVSRAVDTLAGALIKAIKDAAEYRAAWRAITRAQHYDTKDFVDLVDLCAQLTALSKNRAVKDAARATAAAVTGSGFVIAEKHRGTGVARSHGITIYVPRGDASVAYKKLDFARTTRWGSFVSSF